MFKYTVRLNSHILCCNYKAQNMKGSKAKMNEEKQIEKHYTFAWTPIVVVVSQSVIPEKKVTQSKESVLWAFWCI